MPDDPRTVQLSNHLTMSRGDLLSRAFDDAVTEVLKILIVDAGADLVMDRLALAWYEVTAERINAQLLARIEGREK